MSSTVSPVLSMWMSGPLDWLSIACLKSAVREGHEVHLYSYGDVPNTPSGVAIKDANTVIPQSEFFAYEGVDQPERRGSAAPFSDAFRYRASYLDRGIWMDSDMYFLRPIDMSQKIILAWESPRPPEQEDTQFDNFVGNAIMRIPPRSKFLKDLVRLTSKPYCMPPWVSPTLRARVKKKLNGRPFHPGAVTYATVGPVALTYYIRKRRRLADVKPSTAHYPVFYTDVRRFAEEYGAFCAALPPETSSIHIWNSTFQSVFAGTIPPGSFADRLREESLDG